MKFRGLIVAAAVLLVLAGVLYWSEHHKPKESASATTPAILKIDPATVTSVTVKQKGAQAVTLARAGASQWKITSPGDYPADSSAVSAMLSSLAPLNSDSIVEEKAENLSEYGLSDPSLEVDVTGKDNKTDHLLFGDDAPTGGGVYVQLAGSPRVFTAGSFAKSSLNKSLGDLRDKRLLPVEASSVSSIDLDRKGQKISFARIQKGWQIEKPESYRTDNYQVDDLLSQLTGAKWDPSVSAEDATRDFSHATPVATVKLTGSSGTDTLEVRKEKDAYYAKSSAVPGAWKIDSSNASSLDSDLERGLDDFRNKQLFDFGYADPDKIEYHSGNTSIVLARSGKDWISDGKKMDSGSAEGLITAVRDLAASKFVTSGFTNAGIDLTVTSDGGKRVEKVQMQKTSDGAIARRDDGPSLYSLDSAALTGLTDAIAGLKPATPEKKQ
ncbi:MAG TPA: DUF4340 domain-containing protein [Acidobacteriaceae bacterium]|nr:DUF4340 domain-containing protein [Acidobacteriaceae bacterium]